MIDRDQSAGVCIACGAIQHYQPSGQTTLDGQVDSPTIEGELDPELSIIVPVLNEADNILPFVEAVDGTLIGAGLTNFEYIFVDDGSTDETWQTLLALASGGHRITSIRLTRNFGKEAALAAGLAFAKGHAHVPMDVDLQDPPSVVVEMHRLWALGAKVVLARRRQRNDGFAKRQTARAFYALAGRGTAQIPPNVGDFRLMDASVTQRFLSLPERNRFNKGLFALVSSDVAVVDYLRPAGRTGQPRQTWRRLISLGVDGLVSFTTWPLRLISTLGFLLMCVSIVGTIASVILRITGVLEVPGQTTVIVMVLFLAGFQSLAMGVLGEYISRILIEVKSRPLYLVQDIVGTRSEQIAMPSPAVNRAPGTVSHQLDIRKQ